MTKPDLDDISHLLESLNPAQRQAVCASQQNLLVLAGAGSGKTRVLIHRIAWLIQVEGCTSSSILAVTFTNKAANELKIRLQNLLSRSISGLWVGTFHSVAHRMLRLHYQEAKLPQAFQIIDHDDQYRLIRRVLQAMQLDEKKWSPKEAQWLINHWKDQGLRPDIIDTQGDLSQEKVRTIYHFYQQDCDKSGLVDFSEILLRCDELLHRHPALLEHYQQRFRHLLVDEFQDTNALQYNWLKRLAGRESKVFAVGDDDQSIYGWRGARLENIHRYQQEFTHSQLVRLEQNYRSTGVILAAANALIAHNQARLGKNLWTKGAKGLPIRLYNAFNEIDEARFVVERIQAWQEQSPQHRYQQCAVLYRSNALSRALEDALLQAQVPYRVYGGLRFYDRAEIKNALAYLRLIANRDDNSAFERVINFPPRGIGERTVESLRTTARQNDISLWQAALRTTELNARAKTTVGRFLALIEQLDCAHKNMALHELIAHLLKLSGLLEYYQTQKGEKDQMRVENLEELVTATLRFVSSEDENSPLIAFLSAIALDSGAEQAPAHQDCVQLMTLHSSKGLEFPLVFLCGMEEQLFPHNMALQDRQGLEEERRLCYVGMTRAMEQLVLTYAEVRHLHGSERYTQRSRFIDEMPAELVEEVRMRTQPLRNKVGLKQSVSVLPLSAKDQAFQIGQSVVHAKFGEGIILAHEGEGHAERVQVYFSQHGEKWLVLAYAKLSAL